MAAAQVKKFDIKSLPIMIIAMFAFKPNCFTKFINHKNK